MSDLAFDPDLRSSQDDAVLQFCNTAFAAIPQNRVVRWRWLPGHVGEPLRCHRLQLPRRTSSARPDPRTGRSVLRALLPPNLTCSSVQAFILSAMCEYCTEGLHTAREAFLRAENGAAPPRASLADVSGDLLEHGLEPRSLGNRNSATQWRGDWHPPKPESSGRQ